MFHAGKALKVAMFKREVSNVKLAEILGLTVTRIAQYRSSEVIRTDSLVMLAEALDYKPSEFVALGEEL